MDAMVSISSPHLYSLERKSWKIFFQYFVSWRRVIFTIRAIPTSTGHSDTCAPMAVNLPWSSTIPAACKPSSALSTLSAGGADTHSNFMRSLMPSDFNWRMGVVISVRVISGEVVNGRILKVDIVYNLWHTPADVRPARPARWVADATDVGTVASDANAVDGLYTRIWIRRTNINTLQVD